MGGVVRLIIAAVIGGVIAWLLPRDGLAAASQELIAFLSLLMAGLLPAMILTATILRAGAFSARRIEDYGRALRQQLVFWAVLFSSAAVATAGVVIAKMFSAPNVQINVAWRHVSIDQIDIATVGWILAGAGIGVVIQRLRPAYRGLVSLLDLNVTMAKTEALSADRARLDALSEDAKEMARQGN